MDVSQVNAIADVVRQTAFDIHMFHGHGHLEKVYENALAHRLRKAGLNVQQQIPLDVLDEDGTLIGKYCADLLLAAGRNQGSEAPFCGAHGQLMGYLKSCKLQHGLLINFGSARFEIRKYVRPFARDGRG